MSRLSFLEWSPSDTHKILATYEKSVTDIEKDIKSIQEWLAKQPHLPEIPDALFIQKFLIRNKFRIEVVKEKIDNYYSIRSIIPEFYSKLPSDAEFLRIMDTVYCVPLPKLTKDLSRVVILKFKDSDVSNYDPELAFIFLLYVAELRIREDMYLKEIEICDFGDLKFGHVTKISPILLKKAFTIIDAVPAMFKDLTDDGLCQKYVKGFTDITDQEKLLDNEFLKNRATEGLVFKASFT